LGHGTAHALKNGGHKTLLLDEFGYPSDAPWPVFYTPLATIWPKP